MKIERVLFVGLGGAGQRHLRVVKNSLPMVECSALRSRKTTPLLNKDFSVNENASIEEFYNIKTISSLEEGINAAPDMAIVSTPSSLHIDTVLSLINNKIPVLVEKPFDVSIEALDRVFKAAKKNNTFVATSYQRRFNPHFKKIKKYLAEKKLGEIFSVVIDVSTNFVNWHKYEDYRHLYAGRKNLGGGVLLTEIHELDLCYWWFGLPKSVYSTFGKRSQLDIDVEDTAHVVLNYENFSITLNLCFVSSVSRRVIIIRGSQGSCEWTEKGNLFKYTDHFENKIVEESYEMKSLDELFEIQWEYILNQEQGFNADSLNDSYASLLMIDAAKKSSKVNAAIAISHNELFEVEHRIGFMQGRLSPIIDEKIQSFPWLTWIQEIELAAQSGYSFMEWTLDQDRLYENPIMTNEGRRLINQLQNRYNFKILSLTGDCFMQFPFYKINDSEKVVQLKHDLENIVKACGKIEVKYVVIPLVDHGRIENSEQEENLVEHLLSIVDLLEENKVTILFESDYLPQEYLRFISRLPKGYFGVNYDIGNSAALNISASDEFRLYGDRIKNVHIKDRLKGGTTVPLGTGHANFDEVFNELKKINYNQNFILQTARSAEGLHLESLNRYKKFSMKYIKELKDGQI